ncbi:autotransporter domain-containing protein [Komagataeibacter sp. FNDCF1]|uniref:autotransporter domain-containing protein n=1 Tax=Komagataeibacter sp. FNDCF1 TaxID=2878681 RepID=UPI001E3EA174|nr:autotransporter domain-containing protein [Komagataeibacter sp. FNDCF1]MCE2563115.1 autotransporter domain-containing protein [Komagataeibacter sp. FNDCF1]
MVAIGEGGSETFDITNESGATIEGQIKLSKGATNLEVDPGSTITGTVSTQGNSANTLVLGGTAAESAAAGALTMSSALQGGVEGFATLDKEGTSTWQVDRSLNSELVNAKGGSQAVTVDVNAGTLALTADNSSFNGTMTVDTAGTLKIGDQADGVGTAGSLTGNVTDNGAVVFDRSDSATMSGLAIGGTGSVTQEGSGTTTLDTAQTYSGATTISAGTLALSGSGSVTDSSGVTVNSGGTFDISGTTSGTSVQTLDGTGGVSLGSRTLTLSNASGNYGGDMSGTGGLTVAGGTETLAGANTYTGMTTVASAGTLDVTGSVAGNASNAGNLNVTGTVAGTVGNTGTMDVNGGKVGATTNSATLTAENGTLASLDNTGNATLTDSTVSGALANGTGGTATATGGTIGSATNAGTLTLGAGNTVTGDVANTPGGVLTLDGDTINGTLASNGTSLDVTTNGASAGSLSGSGNGTLDGTLTLTNAADTYSGALSGAGGLTVSGGTETLSGANTYGGATTVASGAVLQLGTGGTSGSLDGTSGISDDGTLVVDRSDAVILSAPVSGTGALVQAGAGTTTLTGANSYSGGTTISGGTLAGTTTSFGSGAITDDAALDVDVASTDTDSLANTVTGTGSLTKTGSGTLVLDNAADSYSGGTTVSAGTLQVDGNESQIGGTTTVASGATLSGVGTMGGDVTIASGGTLSPGDGTNSVGTLAIGGNLTEESGSVANFDMGQAGTVGGKYNDLVSVGGNLTIAGTLNVSQSPGGDFGPGVYRLYDYGGTLTNNGVTLAGTDETLQTSVNNEVNLVVAATGTQEQYWDGSNVNGDHGSDGTSGNGQVNGGNGVWTAPGGSGDGNWTTSSGTGNTPSTQGAFDIFEGKGGTVTVDDSSGDVTLSGAQFANSDASSGGRYVITGDTLYSSGSDLTLRVGDGTAAGADTVAEIDSKIDDSKVAGGTTLTKTDGGTLILGGNNSYSGGTDIQGGTLVGTTSSFGTGAINDETGASLTLDQDTDGTLGNGLGGSGTLVKDGSGDVTIASDDSGFTGNTSINDGTLTVDGSLANSSVTVGGAGTLAGTGTVGSTTVANGGTLSPAGGNALGMLTIDGNLNMGAGSTYVVNGGSAGQSDLVSVTGGATLNGGTVEFTVPSGTRLKPGTEYTILTTGTGVTGQFAGLSTNLSDAYTFLSPELLYTADDVDITLGRNTTTFESVANTRNERDVAAVLDGMGGSNAMVNAIEQLNGAQARKAFDALSGEIHASARTALIEDSFYVRNAAIDRLRNAACDPGADANQKTATLKGRRTDGTCMQDRVTLWGEAFGSWGHNSGDGNAGGMNHSVGGFVLGADAPVFKTWRVGGLVSYGRSTFSSEGTDAYGHSNNVTVGGYAGTHWGHLALRMGATYTWAMMSTSRSASFPGFYEKLNSSYNGGVAQGFGDLGYRFDLGKTAIEPFGNVAYVNMHTDSFREHGGAAALNGRAIDTGTTYSTFGVRMSSVFHAGNVLLVPEGSLAYRHTFGATVPTTREAFAAGGSSFDVAGVPLSRDAAVLNAGLRAHLTDRLELGISYIGQYGNRSVDSGLRGRFAWKF